MASALQRRNRMDKKLRNFLYKKIKLAGMEYRILDLIFLAGIILSGFMMRISLKSVVTVDYSYFLERWVGELKINGFGALKEDFYNYNPPYMVILYFISVLKVNPLTGIKVVSCFFDIIIAVTVAAIVKNITKSKQHTMIAFGAAWMLPTVVANGAMWGQCDSIYTSFIMLAIYYILKEKPGKSMIFYGIAFGFKMQSLFILPAFLILWSKRKVKLIHFLNIPLMYFISLLPAVFAGKSFLDTIGLYVGQTKDGSELSYNWPGLYEIFGVDSFYEHYGIAAMCFVVGILMCVMFYLAYKNYEVTKRRMIDTFFYIAMVALYFLPHMHERYGYVGGIIAIIVGVINTKKLYIPVLHVIASYGAYQAWLSDHRIVPFWVYSFMLFYIIIDYGIYIFKDINKEKLAYQSNESKTFDQCLIDLLHKEYRFGKMQVTFLHLLLILGVSVVGLVMRFCFIDYQESGFNEYWSPIIAAMKDANSLNDFIKSLNDYIPIYIIAFYLLSYLPVKLLYSVKAILIIFDFIMAIMSGAIIYDITKNNTKTIGIYSIMLFIPTVVINSAMCSRFEVVCAVAILCTIYFINKGKPAKGMFFYGIAFMMNLQSLFVFPALMVLGLLKKINLKHFLFIPLMYFIGILPAIISGIPFSKLVLTEILKITKLPTLSLSYPNIYQILGTNDFVEVYSVSGIWLTLGIMMGIMFYVSGSRINVTKEFVVQLFLIFLLISVCFLPFMKESYAYIVDIIAVLFAFTKKEKFYIPILQIFISFSAYSLVLAEYINVPIIVHSFLTLYLVFDIGKDVCRYVKKNQISKLVTSQ